MFDSVPIKVYSGNGGSGSISFRREKFVPFGGPDGGDGGNGANVVLRADKSISDLRNYRRKRIFKAEHGISGAKRKMHGRRGEDLVLTVPAGTIVSRIGEDGERLFIADLEENGQEVVVARGGDGGMGNVHFASSTNQVPEIAQQGGEGEEVSLQLEMRLIADVGIIGYPNVGKSTLLTTSSAARPKIANYPFTTLEPQLGVVEMENSSFVMADIPGLIEDAHLGKGLGHEFLRHIMRTRVLVHVVDANSENSLQDLRMVNEELELFDDQLARKTQLVAINKTDLPEVKGRIDEIRETFNNAGIVPFFISAVDGEGVDALLKAVWIELQEVLRRVEKEAPAAVKVFRPKPRESGISVTVEEGVFIVSGHGLDRLAGVAGQSSQDVYWQLRKYLKRLGVAKELERAGIKQGDKVRCGTFEWEWS